jgi:type IV secretory pathway VirD2 relaxase
MVSAMMRKPRMVRADEPEFRLRRKVAWLERLGLPRGSRPGRRAVFEQPERLYGRKSVVKASYARNRKGRKFSGVKMMAHARYLQRGHGHEKGHKEPGFDATREYVDVADTAHNWCLAKDRLHWRIILSPDDVDRIDVREHARKVMAQMEQDLGTNLAWVAIEHDNTDHRHVHIMLRGVRLNEYDRNGKYLPLTMDRQYVSRGIREISEQLIEQQLGPRTEREYLQARGHGIEAERWTEIDRAIERKLRDDIADYGFARYLHERARPRVQQEMERLAYLEGRGFAHSLGDDRWMVEQDFKERLKEMQLEKDVIKNRVRVHARQRAQELELA